MASATYEKKSDSWRGLVCVKGKRPTKGGFSCKSKALSWAFEREEQLKKELAAITAAENDPTYIADNSYTLGMLFIKYKNEVTPSKKGKKTETKKIDFLLKHFPVLMSVKLIDLTKKHFREWIKERANPSDNLPHFRKPSSDGTIRRDLAIFSHALGMARDEWNFMIHDPLKKVQRPKKPKARTRRVPDDEKELILERLGFEEGMEIKLVKHRVALVWLFALETCMRCSEITGLTENDINFKTRVAHLPDTKNGDERDVPLSPRAIEILKLVPRPENKKARYFGITSRSIDSNFRKYRDQTDIEDMTFHDSRHEAITRLVDTGRYNVFEVAAVTGHRDINELLTYYNKSAEDIAKDMAAAAAQNPSKLITSLAGIKDLSQVDGLTDLIQMVAQQTLAVQQAS